MYRCGKKVAHTTFSPNTGVISETLINKLPTYLFGGEAVDVKQGFLDADVLMFLVFSVVSMPGLLVRRKHSLQCTRTVTHIAKGTCLLSCYSVRPKSQVKH